MSWIRVQNWSKLVNIYCYKVKICQNIKIRVSQRSKSVII